VSFALRLLVLEEERLDGGFVALRLAPAPECSKLLTQRREHGSSMAALARREVVRSHVLLGETEAKEVAV
jgi:hypothetical protein